jgi:1-phosphatidylinositol phosphodiesterase
MHWEINCLDERGNILDFEQVLNWCKSHLQNNPSETILMSVKKELESEADANIITAFREYVTTLNNGAYKDLFSKTEVVPILGEVRGKIVLFKRFPFKDFGIDWTYWPDNTRFEKETEAAYFVIDDNYNEHDTHKKADYVKGNMTDSSKSTKALPFYVTFASVAGALGVINTPYQYAWGGFGVDPAMNLEISSFLERNPGRKRWGVVLMDFYNNEGANGNPVANLIRSNY